MATKLELEVYHLLISVQGLGLVLRDAYREDGGADRLPWLASELERLAGVAYQLADENASAAVLESVEANWCPTPLCCLKPGHKEPCQ